MKLRLDAGEHVTPSGLVEEDQTAEAEQASPAKGQVAAPKHVSSAHRFTSAGKGCSKEPLLTATGNPAPEEAKALPKGSQLLPSPFAAAAGTSQPDSSSAAQKAASLPKPSAAASGSPSHSLRLPSSGAESVPLAVASSITSPRAASQALTSPTRGPQSPQRGPQSPQKGPQSPQSVPQSPPWEPLSPPRKIQSPQRGPQSPPRGPQSPQRRPQSPPRAPLSSHMRSERGLTSTPAPPTLTELLPTRSLPLRHSSSDASRPAKELSAAQADVIPAKGKVSSLTSYQSQTQPASDRQNPLKRKRLVKAGSMVNKRVAEAPAAAPASAVAKPLVKPAAVGGLASVPLPKPKPQEKLPTEQELQLLDEDAPYQPQRFAGRFGATLAGRFGSALPARATTVPGTAAQLLRAGHFAPNQPHTASNTRRADSLSSPVHMSEPDSAHGCVSPTEADIRPQSGYRVSSSPLLPAQSEPDQDVTQGPGSRPPAVHASGASQLLSPSSWPMGYSPWAPDQQPKLGQPAAAPALLDKAQSGTAAAVEQQQTSQRLSQHGKTEGKQLADVGQSQGAALASHQSTSASQRQQGRRWEYPLSSAPTTAEPGVASQSDRIQSQAGNNLGTLQSQGSLQIPGDPPQRPPQDPRKQSGSLPLHHEGSHQPGHQHDQGSSEQRLHQPRPSQQQLQGSSRQQPQHLHGSSRQGLRHRSQSQGSQAFSDAPEQAVSYGMKRSAPARAEPEMLRIKLQYRWGRGSFASGCLDLQAHIWLTDTVGRFWNAAGKVCYCPCVAFKSATLPSDAACDVSSTLRHIV